MVNAPRSTMAGEPLRILVIGAHPADVFDQSGGTMAHHAARGDWVGCIVLTHGARIHDKVICDQMAREAEIPSADELIPLMASRADVKAQEVTAACKLLGVNDVYFFGEDDAVLLVTERNVRELAKKIRTLRPEIIITHFPKEDGGVASPHATCGQIVMHAISLAAGVDPDDRTPPHRVAQTFFFGIGAANIRRSVFGSEGGYYNDIFVDISDVAEKKLAAIDHLESQGYAGDLARKWIDCCDGAYGVRARVPYAEGFISHHSTTHYYLPLSDMDRQRARLSDHEVTNHFSQRIALPEKRARNDDHR